MEQRQNKAVYGYIRSNYAGSIPKDVIEEIYKFYLVYFDSKIMNENEQMVLINLLWDNLKKSNKYKDIKNIDCRLLYRGSENEYKARKFHEKCDDKGATITIIHSLTNYIFGGFTSKSWTNKDAEPETDPNVFLFVIRPNVKLFTLKDKSGENAICSYDNYGPTFGYGTDLYVLDRCNVEDGYVTPHTFEFTEDELCGGETFFVTEYEVFGVNISV